MSNLTKRKWEEIESSNEQCNENVLTLAIKKVTHALSRLHTGTFASSQILSQTPIPYIFIKGITQIGLPLTERDAKGICKDDVFKAIEFEQRNPEWEEFLECLKPTITLELGLPGDSAAIQIKPHRMLLCGREATFKPNYGYDKYISLF
jgi:hypothetical protein